MQAQQQPSNADLKDLLHHLDDRIVNVERRLVQHYTEEHRAFDASLAEVRELSDWIKGGKFTARLVVKIAAFLAALGAAWAWFKTYFVIIPK